MIRVWIDKASLTALSVTAAKLRKAKAEIKNRRPAMEKVKQRQVNRWLVNFDSEGGQYDAWPAIAEATEEDRFDEGYPADPILVRTGGLRTNFVSQNQTGRVNEASIFWQFRNAYGVAYPVSHNEGYPNPNPSGGGDIPPRVLWTLDDEDEEKVAAIIERHVQSVISRSGL